LWHPPVAAFAIIPQAYTAQGILAWSGEMRWIIGEQKKSLSLQDFLDDAAVRQQLRRQNLGFQLHDIRKPRRFRASTFQSANHVKLLNLLSAAGLQLLAVAGAVWLAR
jgi:hypothetical protein